MYGTDSSSISFGNSSTFNGNTASISGGAIACVDCVALTLLGLRMSSNKASSFGGALYVEASMAVQSEDTQYIGNRYVLMLPRLCVLLLTGQQHALSVSVTSVRAGIIVNIGLLYTIPCAGIVSRYMPKVRPFVVKSVLNISIG